MNQKVKKLVLGTFNAEVFWQHDTYSSLPNFSDPETDRVVSVMDELLFVFCEPGDTLATRRPIQQAQRSYLDSIGFKVESNTDALHNRMEELDYRECICNLLLDRTTDSKVNTLITPATNISPYAVTPELSKLCRTFDLTNTFPEMAVVKKINSKEYSSDLMKEISGASTGIIIDSSEALTQEGAKILEKGSLIIKDLFGVSGKGNFLITSTRMLARIARHLAKQEAKGKITRFIIEPLLEKAVDFSCHLSINRYGEVKLLSVQKMNNNGFAFGGIKKGTHAFYNFLDKNDYFTQTLLVCKSLYREGYTGYVCIDSMVLQDDTVIPIVEINGRKSMGLINHYLDQYLESFTKKSELMLLNLGIKETTDYETLLYRMEDRGILFNTGQAIGILPMTSNALTINKDISETWNPERYYKGRLYISCIYDIESQRTTLLKELSRILDQMEIKQYTRIYDE